MKIVNKIKSNAELKFSDLSVGDCFVLSRDSEEVFMKTTSEWGRISLNTGYITGGAFYARVYRVSVELNILEII